MAIVEFGIMFNAYLTISNASREAARSGSVGGTDVEIALLVDQVAANLDLAALDVTITPIMRERGDMITVTVSYDYQLITPVISGILSPLINLESITVMRVE